VVVGPTTLKPGKESYIKVAFTMHEGMGGMHLFRVRVRSNDPTAPEKSILVRADYR